MKLLILKGLPASGKTTWAREFLSDPNNKNWVRVNRDDLRNMRGEYWIPKQEKLITDWENNCIISAMESGYSVILDATNLNGDRNSTRAEKLLRVIKFTLEYKSFDTDVQECIKRDLVRANSVGSKVIQGMHDKYLSIKIVYGESESLPPCVIFDVDGTLAKMNGRGPFDWHRVSEDIVNEPIADLSRYFNTVGKTLIIFTGRDGSCLKQTEQWLDDNNIYFDHIFIRPEGNTEKDAIIKKRMFQENIRGKYYCEFVVDDRDQVVEMWRKELGLTCLQVDYGNF